MRRAVLWVGLVAAAGWAEGRASAQYPYYPTQNPFANPTGSFGGYGGQPPVYGPYGPQLSPYLNLVQGRNLAVNYYNGVRPFVPPLGFNPGFGGSGAFGGRPTTYFTQVGTLDQLGEEQPPQRGMAPTGHPAGFQNSLGYFGGIPPTGQGGYGNPAATLRRPQPAGTGSGTGTGRSGTSGGQPPVPPRY